MTEEKKSVRQELVSMKEDTLSRPCEGQPGKNRRCFTETVLFSQTAGRQGGKRWGNAVGSRKRAAGRKSH